MRIQTISGPAAGAAARTRRRQAGFAVPDGREEAAPASVTVAHAAAALEVLPADTPDETPAQASMSDREAARHGQAVLEALARLQLAALCQDGPHEALADLQTGHLRAVDPGLDAVLQAIAARAAVALARSG